MNYNVTAVMKIDAPAMSISVLKLIERILGPEFIRQENEEGSPVYQKGFIKIKILTLNQD